MQRKNTEASLSESEKASQSTSGLSWYLQDNWSLIMGRVSKGEGWVSKGLFQLQQVAPWLRYRLQMEKYQPWENKGGDVRAGGAAGIKFGIWTLPRRLWGPIRIMRTFRRMVLAVMYGIQWEVPAIPLLYWSQVFKAFLPGPMKVGVMGAPGRRSRSSRDRGELLYSLFWPACLPWPAQSRKSEVNREQPPRIPLE